MLWFLTRHEFQLLSAHAMIRAVTVVFLLALLAAASLGMSRAERDARLAASFDARTAQQFQSGAELRADVAATERGRLVLVPPAPLAALAVGQSDVHPSYFKVTARTLDALVTGDQIEHPLAVASGQFDVAFVVLFFYPLLILALGFDLTASERDNGRLRLLLSHPIPLRDIVAAKCLARYALLTAPVVLVPIGALIGLGAGVDRDGLLRLVIWTAAVAAYGLLWTGIVLIVNARGATAAANALVLASIWLTLSVIGPSCVNLLLAVIYPMPSRVEAAVQSRAATQQVVVQGSQELGQFLEDHPTSANVGQEGMKRFAMLQAAREKNIAERLQMVSAGFESQLEEQRRLASILSVLSPTMMMQLVLLDAAGTSTERHQQFRADVEAFQSRWRAYFEPRVLEAMTLTAGEYADAPAFVFHEEPVGPVLRRTLGRLGLLAAAAMVLVWWGFRGYRRYSV